MIHFLNLEIGHCKHQQNWDIGRELSEEDHFFSHNPAGLPQRLEFAKGTHLVREG